MFRRVKLRSLSNARVVPVKRTSLSNARVKHVCHSCTKHVSRCMSRYKETFTRLRSLKTEIEHLQHLLEKSKVQMQKDFEVWWNEQSSLTHRSQNKNISTAWKTPTPPLSPIKPQGNRHRSSSDPRSSQDSSRSDDPRSSRLQTEARLTSGPLSGGMDHWRNPVGSEKSSREDKRHSSAERRDIKNAYEDAKRFR